MPTRNKLTLCLLVRAYEETIDFLCAETRLRRSRSKRRLVEPAPTLIAEMA